MDAFCFRLDGSLNILAIPFPTATHAGVVHVQEMHSPSATHCQLVLLLSAGLHAEGGITGLLWGAALTGLADAHATAASAASLLGAGKISSHEAVTAILLGLTTNSAMKAAMAYKAGGLDFATRVVPGLVLVVLALWLGTWPW